ncbi:MBL fold metallo-hydrolase [Clostridium scatologenes]|uniref:Metallo-beta-lactamase domain protein n=1 Tax=Clostridium scatologenes TaxID=1548 RepID=A0A0E3M8D5_CLOSL|nr:MBL fold metallo-hydrolase [Clostridium scatologenes]AKA68232.1 metallo-beta-lactamase domain protein [Clostridium scatologenes]
MRITTLIENTQDENKNLKYEHGLSMFIEMDDCNILFDTGKSGDFIENAENLNVDIKNTDVLILSHAHYDHCGGVKRLLETYNIKPKLIISEHFFKKSNKYHYSDGKLKSDFSNGVGYKYIGINFDEQYIKNKNLPVNLVKDDLLKINDKAFVFSNFNRYYSFEKINENMKIRIDDKYEIDNFEDEIALCLKTEKGLIVILGCAHPGFLNMINTISERTGEKVIGIIGGTHLIEADNERIEKSIKYLNSLNISILGLSHCTGEKAVKMLNEECKGSFINRTGTILNL